MKNLFRFFLLAALLVSPAFAQGKDTIKVDVNVDGQSIPIRVSCNDPELAKLAQLAFSTHGRYDVQGGRPAYEFKFTAGGNQVRVDILKGSAASVVASEVVTGTSPRNALLKAADVAVAKTAGKNLRGFFASKLAFVSQRSGKTEVYASDLFIGEAEQLTTDRSNVLFPRWSPDGSRIIYTSYFKTGAPDIYVSDRATRRREIFANYKGTNMGARFSPNGQQVVMILGEGAGDIFVKNTAGGNPARRTRSDVSKSSPGWSPDGSQIVFAMGEPSPQLHVMPAGGGTPRRISTGFAFSSEPDWNPVHRNKLACTVRVSGGKFQIAVVDLNGGNATVVSKADYDAVEPSWLADGRHLICTLRDRRTSVLAVLDTETSKVFKITPPELAALQASVWTPR